MIVGDGENVVARVVERLLHDLLSCVVQYFTLWKSFCQMNTVNVKVFEKKKRSNLT